MIPAEAAMSDDRLHTTAVVPAAPEAIFDAWLDGDAHAEMTGAGATGSPRVGARYTAWDGYIEGENLELERPSRIVQSWRTSDFASSDPDSRLEVLLEATDGGTRITLVHTGLPPAQVQDYLQGWQDYYFTPMTAHFGG